MAPTTVHIDGSIGENRELAMTKQTGPSHTAIARNIEVASAGPLSRRRNAFRI